jgi:hypothetical protein
MPKDIPLNEVSFHVLLLSLVESKPAARVTWQPE